MSSVTFAPAPRHLSDVAFRFGPPAPARRRTAAPSSGDCTLEDVLAALARGAGVFESRSGWRLRHAHLRPQLAKALNAHDAEIRAWLELEMSTRPLDTASRGWSHAVQLHATWLTDVLAPSPLDIELAPGVRVADRDVYLGAVRDRLVLGPEGAAAEALTNELASLFARYAGPCRAAQSPARRRFPLAA